MKKFNQFAEEIANVTGTGVAGTGDDSSTVVVRKSGKRRLFTYNVEPQLFDKFRRGKKKYEKWSKYLDLEDEVQQGIYTTAMKNPKGIIVMKNSETGEVRAIRYSRTGGGNWHKISRGLKEGVESLGTVFKKIKESIDKVGEK